ncbi:hypothetical protein [Candidatus Pollutiaquabacter sp.]|uniref:hypothetical protein n=1 Tax=Candidatus Pollutiaquabacter sp. TaxID=3416354 RepID=UPI003CAC2537|nr:hypothetical protein [Bacteroidota bacterium]
MIANVKSRDEILSMLFFLLTLRSALLYARGGKWQHLPILALSFFAALLSKESAITYLAAVPLALYFSRKRRVATIAGSWSPWRYRRYCSS